jgi:PAS domain S-box-containing protein
MKDPSSTNQKRIDENALLKQRIQELEQSESDRKRVEDAILDTKTRDSLLFEHSPDGIVIIDPATARFLEFNETAHRQLGYSREEFARLSISDLDVSETPDETRSHIQKVIREGWSDFETLHRTRQGEIRNIHVTAQYTDLMGHPVYHCIWRDITERKRVEQEMATLAKIGRVINSSVNIEEVYEQFCIETRNLIPFDRLVLNLITQHQAESITISYVFGFDIPGRRAGDSFPFKRSLIEEMTKTKASLFLQPEDEREIIRRFPILRPIVEAGIRSLMVIPLISRDEVMGALHFQSKAKAAYTPADLNLAEKTVVQIAEAIANAQLYSALRKTEQSLRESEKKFRTLVEHAAVGISEVEAGTGRFLAVNPMLCEMIGRTEEEMLATTFMAVTHPDDQNLHPVLSKRMYGGEFDHYGLEKRYLRKDGEVVWVHITISRLWKPGETPGRSITIVHDISERKQMEEALKETLGQLESRVRERTLELQETNTALRVLLKKGDMDQKTLEENLQSNINQLVTPFLSKLKVSQSDSERLTYLNILESNLDNIVSPFINRLSSAYKTLTPKEIQITELIKQGKRSKEIAQLFGISVGTVLTHRNKIRKKLNLKSKDANLRSHLLSLA